MKNFNIKVLFLATSTLAASTAYGNSTNLDTSKLAHEAIELKLSKTSQELPTETQKDTLILKETDTITSSLKENNSHINQQWISFDTAVKAGLVTTGTAVSVGLAWMYGPTAAFWAGYKVTEVCLNLLIPGASNFAQNMLITPAATHVGMAIANSPIIQTGTTFIGGYLGNKITQGLTYGYTSLVNKVSSLSWK